MRSFVVFDFLHCVIFVVVGCWLLVVVVGCCWLLLLLLLLLLLFVSFCFSLFVYPKVAVVSRSTHQCSQWASEWSSKSEGDRWCRSCSVLWTQWVEHLEHTLNALFLCVCWNSDLFFRNVSHVAMYVVFAGKLLSGLLSLYWRWEHSLSCTFSNLVASQLSKPDQVAFAHLLCLHGSFQDSNGVVSEDLRLWGGARKGEVLNLLCIHMHVACFKYDLRECDKKLRLRRWRTSFPWYFASQVPVHLHSKSLGKAVCFDVGAEVERPAVKKTSTPWWDAHFVRL